MKHALIEPLESRIAPAAVITVTGPANANEGDVGVDHDVLFTVMLSEAATAQVTVDYATSDNASATAGTDYVATQGTLVFDVGQTSKTIPVTVHGDASYESDETFTLTLSNALGGGASFGNTSATATIVNDDPVPTITVQSVSQPEGNVGPTNFSFVFTLSAPSYQNVDVHVVTADVNATGSAGSGQDYLPIDQIFTIEAGLTTKTLPVVVNGDTTAEPDETFTVNLSSPVNATIATPQVTGTIVDDDTPPGPTVSVTGPGSITEGTGATAGMATFTITLSADPTQDAVVQFATADGTAHAGSDYVAQTGNVTFLAAHLTDPNDPNSALIPAEKSKTVTVSLVGDANYELTESFFLNLTGATHATIGTGGTAAASINDDDAPPTLTVANVSGAEGNSGTGNLDFTLHLSAESYQTISVHVSTADNTALAGSDYMALPDQVVTFNPGETSKTVSVSILGDTTDETDETFFLNLTNIQNATLGTTQATGTLLNDELHLSVVADQATVTEGDSGVTHATFTVTLDAASMSHEVKVNYATVDGTAVAGADYTAVSGLLTFAPGETMKTVTVDILGDLVPEPVAETFKLHLSNAQNAVVTKAEDTQTIAADSDPVLTLTPSSALVLEGGPNTTTQMHFTLALPQGVTLNTPLTVHFATKDGGPANGGGTATVGTDYVAASMDVTIPAGQTSIDIPVTVKGDSVIDPGETVVAGITYPGGQAGATATGTISDDDNLLVVSDASIVEGDAGTANMVFVVSLLNRVGTGAVTVNYSTDSDTALAGLDFNSKTGSLTFPDGTNQQTVTVPIIGDLVQEATQRFFLHLSNPGNGSFLPSDPAHASTIDGEGVGTITDNDTLPPSFSISGGSVTEGNSGVKNVTFTVTLDRGLEHVITVDFATADGTATLADGDYVAKTQTLTFSPGGPTSQQVTVQVNGDLVTEADETIKGVLSNAVSNPQDAQAVIGTASAFATIQNDDTVATLSGFAVTPTEGNSGMTQASMTVTLDHAPLPGSPVVVNFSVTPNTATLGTDFNLVGGNSVTFTATDADPLHQTITFNIIGDTVNEGNETFNVALTTATNAIVNSTPVQGTITDDDPVNLSIGDATITEGDTGTKTMNFTVTLNAASQQTITVQASTMDNTALAGSDYNTISAQTLTFAPGETTKTVAVNIVGDTTDEVQEQFFMKLSNVTGNGVTLARDTATGTIVDNDLRSLSIGDMSIAEGAAATTKTLTFTVNLSAAASIPVTVNFATADGTATSVGGAADFLATSGSLTFLPARPDPANPGTTLPAETSKTISVTINGDGNVEPDEQFFLRLSGAVNALIADGEAIGRIITDETTYQLVPDVASAVEGGTVKFKVQRFGDLSTAGTVTFTTVDGTANAGADYVANSGVLSFAANEMEKTISVTLKTDTTFEGDETFFVRLTDSTNGALSDGTNTQPTVQQTATIQEAAHVRPTLSISDVTITEGDTGTQQMVFTVALTAANQLETLTVDFATMDGSALDHVHGFGNGLNADYTAKTGTLTFARGETSKTISVTIAGDLVNEPDETFSVKLANAVFSDGAAMPTTTLATVTKDTGTGTIRDNDAAPSISFGGGTNGGLTVPEGSFGNAVVTPTLQLSAASDFPVTVVLGIVPGATALAGADYTAPAGFPGTVTFQPGETSKDLPFTIIADTKHEADKSLTLVASNPTHATILDGDEQFALTITNDDVVPALSIGNVSQAEGDSGTTNFVFTVTVLGSTEQTMTVNYTTVDGTGVGGARSIGGLPDFKAMAGTLTFAPGETSKTISVPVIGDAYAEPDETFTVKLSSPTNATILTDTGTGTIQNGSDSVVALVVQDAAPVAEGDTTTAGKTASFHVELTKALNSAVTFTATTRNGTAVKGSDYTDLVTTTGSVTTPGKSFTIQPGQTSIDVPVSIVGDTAFESTESFFLAVSNVSAGATVVHGEGRGTILNDDIQFLDSKTVRYIDEDGDLATVKVSKGALNYAVATTSNPNPSAVLVFSEANAVGGRILQMVDFTSNPVAFAGTDLNISADPQIGFAASGLKTNGRVDVGHIRGALVDGTKLQFTNGIDFGSIFVEGDVAKITAGDIQVTPSVRGKISVYSLGARGTTTLPSGDTDTLSSFLSVVNALNVTTDLQSAVRVIGADFGDINSLTIGGALRGGTTSNSGIIYFTGTLANAKIGSIVGGSADGSGSLRGDTSTNANIGSLHVLGDIAGGTVVITDRPDRHDLNTSQSGRVIATRISSLVVDGDIVGGAGSDSGEVFASTQLNSVRVLGDVKGGSAGNTGLIFTSGKLNSLRIDGSLVGGAQNDTGAVIVAQNLTSVAIHGNIEGGAGHRSGAVQVGGSIANLTLGVAGSAGGNLLGGTGRDSGTITAGAGVQGTSPSDVLATLGGTIGNVLIYGSIHGGSASGTGAVQVGGQLTKLDVRGSLIGGDSLASGSAVERTGYVAAGRISQMILGGNLQTGRDLGSGLADSGSIRTVQDIASLVIRGAVVGRENVRAVISAGSNGVPATGLATPAIGALTVTGNASYLDVLAGYAGPGTAAAPLGTPNNPDVQIGTVTLKHDVFATNIVAGATEGTDGRFGTLDDIAITGQTPAGTPIADNPAVISSIAKVIISGTVLNNDDFFGIVAQQVKAVTVGGIPVVLNAGIDNDFAVEITAAGGTNMQVDEVGV